MRRLRPGSEAEMVALFLRTEWTSDRFGDQIRALLRRDGLPGRVVTEPDLRDEAENRARRSLLFGEPDHRASYFESFPSDVDWQWVALAPADLARVRYIDYDYWIELSGGSRLAVDAARRVQAGVTVFDVPNDRILRTAQAVADGVHLPPLILVTPGLDGDEPDLMVMEGHVRLTAYLLARDLLPPESEVLLGVSPAITGWDCWAAWPSPDPSPPGR
jgi:hypothetical protein